MDGTACELDGVSRPEFISEERRGVNDSITCLDTGLGCVSRGGFYFEAVFALIKLETERFVNIDLKYGENREDMLGAGLEGEIN